MSHFAEISQDGTVLRVVVGDGDGPSAEAAMSMLLGGDWRQTSYNGNFRGHFAGIGHRYDAELDLFIAPKPYSSWTLGPDGNWIPPTPKPDGPWHWDEASQTWQEVR